MRISSGGDVTFSGDVTVGDYSMKGVAIGLIIVAVLQTLFILILAAMVMQTKKVVTTGVNVSPKVRCLPPRSSNT